MSYEDLEEALAKRAAKEKTTLDKVKEKQGQKRSSPAPEARKPQPEIEVTWMNVVLEPSSAPVAQMY
jgi:hypothetical protein